MGVKFGTEDLRAKFHPNQCNDGGETPKTEIFTEI